MTPFQTVCEEDTSMLHSLKSLWIEFHPYKFQLKAICRIVTSVNLILRNTLPSYNIRTARQTENKDGELM
jgi:hypothetical protein